MEKIPASRRRHWLTGAFDGRSWRALVYLATGILSTTLGWAVSVFAIIAGILVSATVVGLGSTPVLLVAVRGAAALERHRLRLLQVAPIAPPYWSVDGLTGRMRLRARLRDPATWRDLVWLMLAFPLNLACVALAASSWAVALGLVGLPVWYRYLPGGQAKLFESDGVSYGVIANTSAALAYAAIGLMLLWAAGWLTWCLAAGQAKVAGALLGPTRTSHLRERVAILSATRAAAVDGQQRAMRRIERDLHDGARADSLRSAPISASPRKPTPTTQRRRAD